MASNGYVPIAPSRIVNFLLTNGTPASCCKRCAKLYHADPTQICENVANSRRCGYCQPVLAGQGGERCIPVDAANHRRLYQVQSLATAYCHWHDAHVTAVAATTNTTPAFDVSHVVLSGPRKRWLEKNSAGLFLFPSHTPQEYVNLYYASYKLSREMVGSSRST